MENIDSDKKVLLLKRDAAHPAYKRLINYYSTLIISGLRFKSMSFKGHYCFICQQLLFGRVFTWEQRSPSFFLSSGHIKHCMTCAGLTPPTHNHHFYQVPHSSPSPVRANKNPHRITSFLPRPFHNREIGRLIISIRGGGQIVSIHISLGKRLH